VTALTDHERDLLLLTRDMIGRCPDVAAMNMVSRTLADELRLYLTDFGDLEIARVLIQVAGKLAILSLNLGGGSVWDDLPASLLISNLAVAFGNAASELAVIELDYPEASGST
jgi:hypothetical protein